MHIFRKKSCPSTPFRQQHEMFLAAFFFFFCDIYAVRASAQSSKLRGLDPSGFCPRVKTRSSSVQPDTKELMLPWKGTSCRKSLQVSDTEWKNNDDLPRADKTEKIKYCCLGLKQNKKNNQKCSEYIWWREQNTNVDDRLIKVFLFEINH